ncbi:MAG: hypothetical protein LDL07_05105 [Desulfarculus sp.]|nr:hypothetical protein [Desulfarculus sp.]
MARSLQNLDFAPASARTWRGLFAGLFNPKAVTFARLERRFADHPEALALAKAVWLTRRARRLSDWGNGYQARLHLDHALRLKPDFFPARLHLAAIYRQYAIFTGVVSMLETARQLLEEMPPFTRLLGGKVADLAQCGAAVEAERSSLALVLGQREEALIHTRRALALAKGLGDLDPEVLGFVEACGCRLSSEMTRRLEGRLAILAKGEELHCRP